MRTNALAVDRSLSPPMHAAVFVLGDWFIFDDCDYFHSLVLPSRFCHPIRQSVVAPPRYKRRHGSSSRRDEPAAIEQQREYQEPDQLPIDHLHGRKFAAARMIPAAPSV